MKHHGKRERGRVRMENEDERNVNGRSRGKKVSECVCLKTKTIMVGQEKSGSSNSKEYPTNTRKGTRRRIEQFISMDWPVNGNAIYV